MPYFAAFFFAAHRAFNAATSLARASALIFRLGLGFVTGAAIALAGRPGRFLAVVGADAAIKERACLRVAISASMRAKRSVVLMGNSVTHRERDRKEIPG